MQLETVSNLGLLCTSTLNTHILVPWVLFTGVLPAMRLGKVAGALMSYHSLRVNGSTLCGG